MNYTENQRRKDLQTANLRSRLYSVRNILQVIKKNLVSQLNNIDVVNPDGSVENLGQTYGNKKKNS